MASDQDAMTTAVLLLGGGAAGYALGRLVLDRSRSAGEAALARPSTSIAASTAPSMPRANPAATAVPQQPQTTKVTRPISMPVGPRIPITTTSTGERPYAAPPPGAQPIDPYAEPTGSLPPRVLVGPPASAVPIDPYATPAHAASPPTAVHTGPITSPSQLEAARAQTESAALGAELAGVLTSTDPSASASSRRPVLPSTSAHAGPITSPSQVSMPGQSGAVARPPIDLEIGPVQILSPNAPTPIPSSALPRRFDPVFERYRGSIPIEFLRALVARESSFNPLALTGSAIGLMQIVPVVRDDYNKRHGTPYHPEHLYDPTINVAIGCELLRIIIASYRKNHPRIPNMQANWDNARYAELLVFGWNAGFSEAGGVGRVARYLERLGTVEITIDLVHEHARAAGASKHLANPAKVRWCKSVVALYLRERAVALPQRYAARSLANPY